ncbi:hypothetical protein DPMN_184109 [Dreissena polymorpha]|uniref:Uncharacterized protein n=2 Tax=Dreissena polymorpha TaxID=45954 RepID=A0A9D4DIL0_DREPO|nr:hypothetical protein DPMN_184109 [Dreissena polymorpha]
MKERLKDVDIQAITARKLALQVVGTHWSPSGQALLNRTLFGAACQPRLRIICTDKEKRSTRLCLWCPALTRTMMMVMTRTMMMVMALPMGWLTL